MLHTAREGGTIVDKQHAIRAHYARPRKGAAMSRKTQIDADEIREQVLEAGKQAKALAEQGIEWASPKVESAVKDAVEWASPKVEAAVEWASPRIEHAWKAGLEAAGPKVEEAAAKASGLTDVAAVKAKAATDTAHDALVDVIIPRVVAAMQEAARAAAETGSQVASAAADKLDDVAATVVSATEQVVDSPVKKSGNVGKTIGWIAAGAATAAAGYLVWRRTKPLDDPWAEEYWEDIDESEKTAPEASAAASAILGEGDEPASDEEIVEALVDAVAEAEVEAELAEDSQAVVDEAEAALEEAAAEGDETPKPRARKPRAPKSDETPTD